MVHRVQDAHPDAETQIVISGHSHRPVTNWRDRILYLNPGAAGRQGFHRERTACRLGLDGVAIPELVSLGPKSREGSRPRTPSQKELALTSQNVGDSATGGHTWPKVTMYTTSWCPDCRASKRFLTQNGVPFTEIDIEDQPQTAEIVRRINNGMRKVPTVVIEGGPTLVEPSDRELGQALGVA